MDVRMPDGTLVRNVPDDITQTDLLARYNKFKAPEPEEVKPPEKGNFITDTLGGLATGAGKLMATPTEFTGLLSGEKPYKAEDTPEALLKSAGIPSSAEDVYKGVLNALTPKSALGLEGIQNKISGLGSGILNPFKATQPLSAELQAAGENIKSTKEKRLEAERAAAIDKEEGLLNEAKTAVGFTLSNPSMLPGFIAEQIPNLLLPAGAGKLGMGVAKSLITNATEKALTRVGVSSAVAAAAAQQGGDTGADTYEAVHKYLIDQGVPEKEAHDIAVEKSKVAAGKAAAISVATGFIPGANALERKLIGAAETGVAKKGLSKYATTGLNVAGEATQEGIEEGGGKYVSNVGLQQVAPETDVMKGVGSSAGLGMLGGAIFGGLTHGAGRTPSTQTPIAKNEWVLDENGNLVKNPETQIEPKGTVTLGPIENAAQQDLFGAGELPNQVDQGILNEKQKQESEIERNIFALQQQEQTPEVKQQIEALQAQLPKGPGQTLDTLQEEHSALNRAYTALDTQKATLEQQREAIPKLDDKLVITEQIKTIEAQQTQIDTRRAELQEQAKKLTKQITPEETTAQRKLKEVSPIVGNVMSKFGLTPKAPIRNAIKNLDMTVPEDRQTFIDEINKHSIKGAKINMEEVEKYLSYFEEKPSGELNRVDTGAVKPSVPVSGEGTTPTEGFTAPVATGMENNIGTPVGLGTGTETLQNVQPNTLEEPSAGTLSFGSEPPNLLTNFPPINVQTTPTTTPQATSKTPSVGIEPTMEEVIKSNPGANIERLAQMLGPQLYGSMEKITQVSVKEMFQNSYDAIKTMLQNGSITKGKLDIRMNKKTRSISVIDNGSGMTPDVLGNVFLTIAGTKKDTDISSGGFGIAKLLFLYGNKEIEVISMRDGKISKMSTTGEQLRASLNDPSKAPNITVTDATKDKRNAGMFPEGHGTYVSVVVPEKYKDPQTGEEKDIPFGDSKYDDGVLEYSPLFANIDVEFNGDTVYNMGSSFVRCCRDNSYCQQQRLGR